MHPWQAITTTAVACLVFVAACGKREQTAPIAQPDPPPSSASAVLAPGAFHGWLGTWIGPEGTFLKLVAKPDSTYEITIKNLDGERTFEGVGGSAHIDFERDGARERIRATDGKATGMKWLADKSKCLTVKTGEGYCRE